MTLDLLFVGANSGRATLDQLGAELDVRYRLIAQRITTMEIFPVSGRGSRSGPCGGPCGLARGGPAR